MNIYELEKVIQNIAGIKVDLENRNETINDLGIDSLNFLEIIVEIETIIKKKLPEEDIFSCDTVGDLLKILDL